MSTQTREPSVVYLGHSAAMSGAEIALMRLLDVNGSHRATVILGEDGPLIPRLRAAGAEVIVMPLPEGSNVVRGSVTPRALPAAAVVGTVIHTIRTAFLLRRLRPDVVHTNSMKAHLYGGVAARLVGIPHVWHARDRAAPDYMPQAAVRVVRAAARVLPAVVLANSAATLATYPGVRNGVVIHDAAPDHVRRAPVPDGPLRIGMIGRLAPWKGQDVFLDAFAAAFTDGPQQAMLVGDALFGEHEYAELLHSQVDGLGIADRVQFTGFTDDVPAVLDHLHVLVHCSTIPEPFGQVIVEGMTAGVPVIATAAGGPREIVDTGRTGVLVRPNDVADLADALVRFDRDPELRSRIGSAARTASARFRPERVASQVRAVHRAVAHHPRGASVTLDTRVGVDAIDVRTAPLTAVICTRDEEELIERVIASVPFADEVLVCDSGSTDRTRQIAREAGARVIDQPWLGFSRQKNHAASLARNDWILSLDADEIVAPDTADDIVRTVLADPPAEQGFAVDRRGVFFGAELPNMERRSTRDSCVRLYNRTRGGWDEDMTIHEVVRVPGNVRRLDGHLAHRRALSMDDFFRVFNRNASTEARELVARGSSVTAVQVTIRPVLRFVWCYLIKRGFRSGSRGLVHACVAASSDLMRFAKAWEHSQAIGEDVS